jgi:hypothetical protein
MAQQIARQPFIGAHPRLRLMQEEGEPPRIMIAQEGRQLHRRLRPPA